MNLILIVISSRHRVRLLWGAGKEKCRKIKALFSVVRFALRTGLPAWVVLCLADCIRRSEGNENFQHEIVKLQQRIKRGNQ
jgi:hypothetical protein